MKWMLIVVVFGVMPVKTNLLFDSIDDCLVAEEAMRAEYAQEFNQWLAWAKQNQVEAGYPKNREFMMQRIGLENRGTCIPHGELPSSSN